MWMQWPWPASSLHVDYFAGLSEELLLLLFLSLFRPLLPLSTAPFPMEDLHFWSFKIHSSLRVSLNHVVRIISIHCGFWDLQRIRVSGTKAGRLHVKQSIIKENSLNLTKEYAYLFYFFCFLCIFKKLISVTGNGTTVNSPPMSMSLLCARFVSSPLLLIQASASAQLGGSIWVQVPEFLSPMWEIRMKS